MTPKQELIYEYENRILRLIDEAEDFDRSDLQGAVTAIVMQLLEASKKEGLGSFSTH